MTRPSLRTLTLPPFTGLRLHPLNDLVSGALPPSCEHAIMWQPLQDFRRNSKKGGSLLNPLEIDDGISLGAHHKRGRCSMEPLGTAIFACLHRVG